MWLRDLDRNIESAIIFVCKVFTSLATFGGIALFTRLLPAADLGVYFLFHTVIAVLASISGLGVPEAITQRVSSGGKRDRIFSVSVTLIASSLISFTLLIVAFEDVIADYLGGEYTLLLVGCLTAWVVARTVVGYTDGLMAPVASASAQFLGRFVWLATGYLLIHVGVEALLIGLLLDRVSVACLLVIYSRPTLTRPTWDSTISVVDYAKYNYVSALGWNAFSWTDTLLIGFFLGAQSVSLYEVSWQLTLIVGLIAGSLDQVLLPNYGRLYSEDEIDALREAISDSLSLGLSVTVPASVGVVVLAEPLLTTLFTEFYGSASLILAILVLQKPLLTFSTVLKRMLQATGRIRSVAVLTAAAIVVTVALNLLLIPPYGLEGAAVATVVAYATYTGAIYSSAMDHIPVQLPGRDIARITVYSAIMGGVVYVLQQFVPADGTPTLAFSITVGVVIYGGLIAADSALRSSYLEMMGVGDTRTR